VLFRYKYQVSCLTKENPQWTTKKQFSVTLKMFPPLLKTFSKFFSRCHFIVVLNNSCFLSCYCFNSLSSLMNAIFNQPSHTYLRKSIYCTCVLNRFQVWKKNTKDENPLRHSRLVFIADYIYTEFWTHFPCGRI